MPLTPLPLIRNAANFTHLRILAFKEDFALSATRLVTYFQRKTLKTISLVRSPLTRNAIGWLPTVQ